MGAKILIILFFEVLDFEIKKYIFKVLFIMFFSTEKIKK